MSKKRSSELARLQPFSWDKRKDKYPPNLERFGVPQRTSSGDSNITTHSSQGPDSPIRQSPTQIAPQNHIQKKIRTGNAAQIVFTAPAAAVQEQAKPAHVLTTPMPESAPATVPIATTPRDRPDQVEAPTKKPPSAIQQFALMIRSIITDDVPELRGKFLAVYCNLDQDSKKCQYDLVEDFFEQSKSKPYDAQKGLKAFMEHTVNVERK